MIYLGADHGGFELKRKLAEWLTAHHYTWIDLGAQFLDHDDDYPIFAKAVAQAVGKGTPEDSGMLVCRSGGGMTIAANKFPNIRAVNCIDETMAAHARDHNDANILVLSGDFISEEKIYRVVETFLTTPFSQHKRHVRRLSQIAQFEQQQILALRSE